LLSKLQPASEMLCEPTSACECFVVWPFINTIIQTDILQLESVRSGMWFFLEVKQRSLFFFFYFCSVGPTFR